jgi:hypothetical protein
MDYEKCLETFNDPEMCMFGFKVVQLAETLRLEECLDRRKPQKCLEKCLKSCGGRTAWSCVSTP